MFNKTQSNKIEKYNNIFIYYNKSWHKVKSLLYKKLQIYIIKKEKVYKYIYYKKLTLFNFIQ